MKKAAGKAAARPGYPTLKHISGPQWTTERSTGLLKKQWLYVDSCYFSQRGKGPLFHHPKKTHTASTVCYTNMSEGGLPSGQDLLRPKTRFLQEALPAHHSFYHKQDKKKSVGLDSKILTGPTSTL